MTGLLEIPLTNKQQLSNFSLQFQHSTGQPHGGQDWGPGSGQEGDRGRGHGATDPHHPRDHVCTRL